MSKEAGTTKFGARDRNGPINFRFTANAVWTTGDAATRTKKKRLIGFVRYRDGSTEGLRCLSLLLPVCDR